MQIVFTKKSANITWGKEPLMENKVAIKLRPPKSDFMTYSRFEDLPVWKEAIQLASGVYNMTEGRDWKGSRSLRDQTQRAALPVSNNIYGKECDNRTPL